MSPNVVLMPILKKKKIVVLSPQHPQQQQHQPTVSGQFQPHAQAEDLVSDTTEYATAAPVLISQSIASSHFSPPTPHRLCTSCFSPPTHHPGHFSAPPHTAPVACTPTTCNVTATWPGCQSGCGSAPVWDFTRSAWPRRI